jgi:maltose/moltooligosaccharide transporter
MQKFNTKKVILIVLINAALQVLWIVYNSYIPLYLQGGNTSALGEGAAAIPGFGLNPGLTGFIMTLDNILALFIGPFVGMLSDSSKSRLGRRMPFLLFPMPFMVIGLIIIGFIPNLIPPENSGNFSALIGLFVPFFLALAAVLVGNAFMDSPRSALLFDWTPSSKRTMATGISILVATLTVVVVVLSSSMLFELFKPLPFLLSAFVLLVAVLLVFFFVKDAPTPSEVTEESLNPGKIMGMIRSLPKDLGRSLIFYMLAMFTAYLGVAIVQAFLTSYAVSIIGMEVGAAGMLMAIFAIGGALMALPAAWLAGKFGRRRMMIIGFGIMVLASIVMALVPNQGLLMGIMVVTAIGWIMANVGQTPMMADHAPSDTYLATFISILVVISTLSNIVGPILGGWIVEMGGNNYNLMWPMIAAVFVLAIIFMIPVTRGEARKEKDESATNK